LKHFNITKKRNEIFEAIQNTPKSIRSILKVLTTFEYKFYNIVFYTK